MAFDWKSLVSTVAPILGTALGSPLAGMAVSAICSAFGLDTNSDEAVVAQAMRNATPEQLVALQNAERQFKLDMEKLGVDLAKINAEDRNSARQMQMATKDWMPKILASVYAGGSLALAGYIVIHGLGSFDTTTVGLVGTVVGYLFNEAKASNAFYFGSSAGSRDKDNMIYNSTPPK